MEKIDYKEYLNSVNLSDKQREFFNAIEKNTITVAIVTGKQIGRAHV